MGHPFPTRTHAQCRAFIEKTLDGIAAAIKHDISNALTEGLNSKIETVKRDACGFRNKGMFRTAILFHCGKLDMNPEAASP